MRTKRTDGSTTYTYTYDGSTLTRMTVGSNTYLIQKSISYEQPNDLSTSERVSVWNYFATSGFGLNCNFFLGGGGDVGVGVYKLFGGSFDTKLPPILLYL